MTAKRKTKEEREQEWREKYEEHIRREVEKAPPLSDEQRARLTVLLRPGVEAMWAEKKENTRKKKQ